jgi:hypothetical protein
MKRLVKDGDFISMKDSTQSDVKLILDKIKDGWVYTNKKLWKQWKQWKRGTLVIDEPVLTEQTKELPKKEKVKKVKHADTAVEEKKKSRFERNKEKKNKRK